MGREYVSSAYSLKNDSQTLTAVSTVEIRRQNCCFKQAKSQVMLFLHVWATQTRTWVFYFLISCNKAPLYIAHMENNYVPHNAVHSYADSRILSQEEDIWTRWMSAFLCKVANSALWWELRNSCVWTCVVVEVAWFKVYSLVRPCVLHLLVDKKLSKHNEKVKVRGKWQRKSWTSSRVNE